MNRIQAKMYRKRIEQAAESLDDETALTTPELFPHWRPGMDAKLDERMFYYNKLYRVVQPHTTQEGWEPDKTPALFTEVAKPGEIPVWKRPTGAQDAYMIGDKVYYPERGDQIYVSTVNDNVWEPGVFGWELQQ